MFVLGVRTNVGLEESIFEARFRLQWVVNVRMHLITSIIQLNRCVRDLSFMILSGQLPARRRFSIQALTA
jgi:hypothetical protein